MQLKLIKKAPLSIAVIIFSLLTYSSCTNDKAAVVPPACDTATVRLSVELNTILADNCLGCHGGNAGRGAGIKLEDFTTIHNLAISGTLLNAIQHTGNVTPMPIGGGKLSDCEIKKFVAWVNRGAPEN